MLSLGRVRHERWSRFRAKVRYYCRTQELKYRSPLLVTSLDDGPDALAPAAAIFTARALRDPPMDRHEPNGLFGQLVGRFDVGLGNESEVALPVLPKASCQVVCLGSLWRSSRGVPYQLVASLLQFPTEPFLRSIFIAAVDHAKQFSQVGQQSLTMGLVLLAGHEAVCFLTGTSRTATAHRSLSYTCGRR